MELGNENVNMRKDREIKRKRGCGGCGVLCVGRGGNIMGRVTVGRLKDR